MQRTKRFSNRGMKPVLTNALSSRIWMPSVPQLFSPAWHWISLTIVSTEKKASQTVGGMLDLGMLDSVASWGMLDLGMLDSVASWGMLDRVVEVGSAVYRLWKIWKFSVMASRASDVGRTGRLSNDVFMASLYCRVKEGLPSALPL